MYICLACTTTPLPSLLSTGAVSGKAQVRLVLQVCSSVKYDVCCVCQRETDRESDKTIERQRECVCVCVTERERERKAFLRSTSALSRAFQKGGHARARALSQCTVSTSLGCWHLFFSSNPPAPNPPCSPSSQIRVLFRQVACSG